jgi:hypothetical protein
MGEASRRLVLVVFDDWALIYLERSVRDLTVCTVFDHTYIRSIVCNAMV